jgi:hypothetical protein
MLSEGVFVFPYFSQCIPKKINELSINIRFAVQKASRQKPVNKSDNVTLNSNKYI